MYIRVQTRLCLCVCVCVCIKLIIMFLANKTTTEMGVDEYSGLLNTEHHELLTYVHVHTVTQVHTCQLRMYTQVQVHTYMYT